MAANKQDDGKQQHSPEQGHNFRLQCITWNVCDTTPHNVAPLFIADGPPPDLISVGLQEAPGNPATAVIFEDSWGNAFMKHLAQRGYVKIRTEHMQAILLHVFVKVEHLPRIRQIKTAFTRTGIGGYWGNKGAVTVRLDLYGSSVCISNAHMAAHLEQNEIRIQEYYAIMESQRFPGCKAGTILEHDYIFWIGDLNFRLDPIDYDLVMSSIAEGRFKKLLEFDQLKEAQREGLAFPGFSEGDITFQPTYKFDKGTNVYDTSEKQRKPGWCDRILWRARPGAETSVRQDSYTSLPHIRQSDHSPVTSMFSIQVDLNKNQPLVRFEPVRNWTCGYRGVASYSVVMEIPTSGWDWIGLYKEGFCHPKDYHTYVWGEAAGFGKGKRGCLVVFEPPYMPDEPGQYLLCYWSTHFDCVIGVSEPFEITKPQPLEEAIDALTLDKKRRSSSSSSTSSTSTSSADTASEADTLDQGNSQSRTDDSQAEGVAATPKSEESQEERGTTIQKTEDNQEESLAATPKSQGGPEKSSTGSEKNEGGIEEGKEEARMEGETKSDLEVTSEESVTATQQTESNPEDSIAATPKSEGAEETSVTVMEQTEGGKKEEKEEAWMEGNSQSDLENTSEGVIKEEKEDQRFSGEIGEADVSASQTSVENTATSE